MRRPPLDFDLSTSHMPGEYYVPPKARDANEIARRRDLVPGELVLEHQQRGLYVARTALGAVTDRESLGFALPIINLSALNSVWHMYAEPERTLNDSIRRRRLKLPIMKDWQDGAHLLEGVKHSLAQGQTLAARLVLLHGTETKDYETVRRDFSVCVGNAALAGAAVVGLGEDPIPGSPLRAQQFAREQAFTMLESRAAVAGRIGSAPTLAQMADADSDVSVWWRRNAPEQAYTAYIEAQSALAA